ncbi:hypothetical protein PCE1_002090 [Barthelona sp. PCE]
MLVPIAVSCMLIFGMSTVVTQKVLFSLGTTGCSSKHPQKFQKFAKPSFQTLSMFVGMALCLCVFYITKLFKKKDKKDAPLLNDKLQVEQPKAPAFIYMISAVPSLCDLCATLLLNISLLFISASVWQLLRGSMTVFTALMSRFILKKALPRFKWTAVAIIVFALTIVGASSLLGPTQPGSAPSTDTLLQLFGIIVALLGVVFQSLQVTFEQKLMADYTDDIPPALLVGIEGLYGMIFTGIILYIAQHLPQHGMIGHFYENTTESLCMLGKSNTILFTVIIYCFFILAYNLSGMYVTKFLSAVMRSALEGLRTLTILMANLIIHYLINPGFGEIWSRWTVVELLGFAFLIVGVYVYNGTIKLRGMHYPEEDKAPLVVSNHELSDDQ